MLQLIPGFLSWSCTGEGNDRQWFIWHLGLGFGLWWASQLWITRYIWTPKAPRLAFTERYVSAGRATASAWAGCV